VKNYVIKEKYYKYKNIIKNRKCRDNNNTHSALDKFVKLILDYKNFEEKEEEYIERR